MNHEPSTKRSAFTLIEVLVVIAIIGILAAVIIPAAGSAKETALKRRAATEMNSIKVAILQFQADHKYMPWPPGANNVRVGEDKWAADETSQIPVMDLLTGNNALKKGYLQIPEKSRRKRSDSPDSVPPMRFLDPWEQPYVIGMDRNLDGAMLVANAAPWNGATVMEKVLVYCPGPPGKNAPLKTFDVQ